MTILGLPRLSASTDQEWQNAVKRQISDLIRQVLKTTRSNLQYDILYVLNPIKGRPRGQTVVNVKMDSVDSSKRFRDIFSGFFSQRNRVPLPGNLKGVSVRNRVTLDTRIRITILHQLASNYKESNPGSSVKVRGYNARPTLLIVPPRSASGPSRPSTFTFMEAVTKLPATLSDENLTRIFKVVRSHHQDTLRKYFVILSDDDRARCEGLVQSRAAVSSVVTTSGHVSGPSSGMDLQAGFLASLRCPPPPPPLPVPVPDVTTSGSRSDRRSSSDSSSPERRGLKRNRHSPPGRHKSKRSRRLPSSSSSSSSTRASRSRSRSRSRSSSSPPRRAKSKSKPKSKSRRR